MMLRSQKRGMRFDCVFLFVFQIRCLNAISLNCCSQNQRTVLIVCAKYWQIYDAGDFTVLCSVISPSGERWLGGDFLAHDRVILWSDEGKGYLYRLPAK